MALPTASLGSLPSLNLPYAVPRYEVTRGRDKLLTALAVALAQGVGQNVVGNVMSRDYADQVKQTPAGFWSKLVSGPQVNEAQLKDIKTREAVAANELAERQLRQSLANQSDATNRLGITTQEKTAQADRTTRETIAKNDIQAAMARMVEEGNRRNAEQTADNRAKLQMIDREAEHRRQQAGLASIMDFMQKGELMDKELASNLKLVEKKGEVERMGYAGLPTEVNKEKIDTKKLEQVRQQDSTRPHIPSLNELKKRGVTPEEAMKMVQEAMAARKKYEENIASGQDYATQMQAAVEAAKTGKTPEQVLQEILQKRKLLEAELSKEPHTQVFMPY